MTATTLLPHDEEAEMLVIGGLLVQNWHIRHVAAIVSPNDFYLETNRALMNALVTLGEAADLISVERECRKPENRELFPDGGVNQMMIATLAVTDIRAMTESSIDYYARIVAGYALKRRMILAAQNIATAAFKKDTEPQALLTLATAAITEATSSVKTGEATLQEQIATFHAERETERAQGGKPVGVLTGLTDLDRMTGGLKPGQLVTIAARPGAGKSLFMAQVCRMAAAAGKPSALLSLEMNASEIMGRMVAAVAGKPLGKLTEDEEAGALLKIGKLPLRILTEQVNTLAGIVAAVYREYARTGGELALVAIDYIGLVQTPTERGQTRAGTIGAISRALKAMAVDLKIAVIVGSQLNRSAAGETDTEAAPPPQLYHLFESSALEQDSNTVLMLHDPREQSAPSLRTLYVRKQRGGQTGAVKLIADLPTARLLPCVVERVEL